MSILARLALVLAFVTPLLAGQVRDAPLPATAEGAFAIRNARVFDGERVLPRATVVVVNGAIAAVAPDALVPPGAQIFDAAGRTLLPGLIDAHTHTREARALETALAFGVTTQFDMNTLPEFAAERRRRQAAGLAAGQADLLSAGTAVTVPGGHGSARIGSPPPMLEKATDVAAFVDARIAEGSDYIKIVVDDGSVFGKKWPTLDRPAIAALIRAAHARGKQAVVHVTRQADAEHAVRSGADGLVHVWLDGVPNDELLSLFRQRRTFVIPTLVVWQATIALKPASALLDDSRVTALLPEEEARRLREPSSYEADPSAPADYQRARSAVAALNRAGVPILAGTDAPNPGTAYGASLFEELRLLVEAGLSPTQALAAATAGPAEAFGLRDRGRIAPGRRADLVLVEGDPTASIADIRAVVEVWKGGVRFDRGAYAARLKRTGERTSAPSLPAIVSDFDKGSNAVAFGNGWLPSADSMRGGKSSVKLDVANGGAAGSAGALRISADVAAGAGELWAGAIFFPAAGPNAPADLSAATGFRFYARGDGATYRVRITSRTLGQTSPERSFRAGADWQLQTFAWSDFGGNDGRDVTRILIAAGPSPGKFELFIDQFEIR